MVTHFGEQHLAVDGEAEFSGLGIRPEGTDSSVRVPLQPPKFRDLLRTRSHSGISINMLS